jgi:hypothetical protein
MKTWLAVVSAAALICSCANVERTAEPAQPVGTSQMGAAAAAELGFHGPVYRNNPQYGQ